MYEQIKEAVRRAVFSGELRENTMLPSVRQLAADLNVSTITTKRAYSDLEQEGVIYTAPGRGTFIKPSDKNVLMARFKEKQLEEFSQCARKMLTAGFTKSELEEAVKKL
ncbi:MAG: GntR family transcriptional regulator [Ruminococcus sp.]|nr:GntR family transcriptional regulator [Ruminococcus sp.]